MFRRDPFRDLIRRQLELFEQQEAILLRQIDEAERAYNAAPRDEAEARYERYDDLVQLGAEALAEIRDAYARTLDEDTADEYRTAFNDRARKRLPRFGLELD